jgi:hypothetical protein
MLLADAYVWDTAILNLPQVLDLRSQVSKEACISISQLAHILGARLDSHVSDLVRVVAKVLSRAQVHNEQETIRRPLAAVASNRVLCSEGANISLGEPASYCLRRLLPT